jgi:hypothetical protein
VQKLQLLKLCKGAKNHPDPETQGIGIGIQENHSRYLGSSLAREFTSNLNDLNAKTEDFAIKCNQY